MLAVTWLMLIHYQYFEPLNGERAFSTNIQSFMMQIPI